MKTEGRIFDLRNTKTERCILCGRKSKNLNMSSICRPCADRINGIR